MSTSTIITLYDKNEPIVTVGSQTIHVMINLAKEWIKKSNNHWTTLDKILGVTPTIMEQFHWAELIGQTITVKETHLVL